MRKLALLLLPEFSNFSLAAVTEPLFIANWLAQEKRFEWRSLSADGKPVRASNGSTVSVEGDLALAHGCASVFVLASFEPAAAARNRTVVRWLRRIARSGVELVGIENGSLALADAGLLEEHAAAVHWDNLAGFQELFPRVRIAQSFFSFSQRRVTCAGAAAILDMMVAWIELHADRETAAEVARHLLLRSSASAFGRRFRSSATSELRDLRADGVHLRSAADATSAPDVRSALGERSAALVERSRAMMRANIDDPLSCDALAQRLDVSLRQLERVFKQILGHTLHTEYRLVRLERAHQYLQQTRLPVTEVAALTGFSSIEYFSKVYKRVFGVLPSTDRRQSTDAPVFRAKVEKRGSG